VPDGQAQFHLDDAARVEEFAHHLLGREPAQIVVMDAVRADGDQRMGREAAQLVPVHERRMSGAQGIDAAGAGETADDLDLILLGDPVGQVVVDFGVGPELGRRRVALEDGGSLRRRQVDDVASGDDLLEQVPPEQNLALRQRRRDVDGDRRAVAFEHRQRVGQVVAVAVVGGDRHEALGGRPTLQAVDRLVHRDEGVAQPPHLGQDGIEERRRHGEVPVDADPAGRSVIDLVQHQDGADAAEQAAGERGEQAQAGAVQHQLPEQFSPVDHSFTNSR
jgi:hypothetical protein